VDGFLVDPRDTEELTDVIQRLLHDPERARQTGEAGRRKVLRSYTWDRVVDRAEALYQSLLSRPA
jgi:D-inositol-3-phosphate glycosyltransferase